VIERLFGEEPLNKREIVETCVEYARRIRPYVRDTAVMLYEAAKAGKKILFEGAQGALLDIDLGTYPYVTSSHPTSGGFTTGTGVGPGLVSEVLGVTKAYTTRVGKGPFITELENKIGDKIREIGREYGATTGRPRRCGWFDGVVARYSARVNNVTGIALTLLDVLGSFDTIEICLQYELNGKKLEHFPARLGDLAACRPVYKTFKGWNADISRVRTWEDLPEEAKAYVLAVEETAGVPVKIVSVGPGREQTIVREEVF
jgi:adenylosuccinate synthase